MPILDAGAAASLSSSEMSLASGHLFTYYAGHTGRERRLD
jgi:hypothetical protein